MRERDRFQRGVLRAPEDVRGAGISAEEGNAKSGETKELSVLDRAFHNFLFDTRIRKISRESALAKSKAGLSGDDLKEFESTTEWYKPVFDAFDEYDRRMKQQGARQGDVRAWALRGLSTAGIEEFDRIYDDVYTIAQEQPLGEHYARKAQNVPAPSIAAGTTEREMLSSSRQRERKGERRDSMDGQRRDARVEKRQFLESGEVDGSNGNGNGNGEVQNDPGEFDPEVFVRSNRPAGFVFDKIPFWIGPDRKGYNRIGQPFEHGTVLRIKNPEGDDKPRLTRYWNEKDLDFTVEDPFSPEERAERRHARKPQPTSLYDAQTQPSAGQSVDPLLAVAPEDLEAAERLGQPMRDFLRLAMEENMPMGIAIEQVTAQMNVAERNEFIDELAHATRLARDVLLDRRARAYPQAPQQAREQARPVEAPRVPEVANLYEAQAHAAREADKPAEYKSFMNGRFRVNEEGKAEVIFRDGRRQEVEDGKPATFRNSRGEKRKMVFDLVGERFVSRESYNQMMRNEEKREQEGSQENAAERTNIVEFSKPAPEPFQRIKPPDPKELKLITDELAADTGAHFAEGSKLLTEIAAKEKPEKLVQAVQEQLPKIAEVDRRGFERIKLRVGALASFEKGEYKTLKGAITALGRRFGVRAETFDRLAEEKDPKARLNGFRVEIEISLGTLGRLVNFLTRRLYSRWRARSFDSTSRALNQHAESALQEHRRSIGAEIGTVIGRNRTIREFFSMLLKKDKDKSGQEEENIESRKLAA